jgi:hypothetical protein
MCATIYQNAELKETDILLVPKEKSGIITAVNWTFPKITPSKNKYSLKYYGNKRSQHSRYHKYAIFILKNIPKIINILIVIKILKRIKLT